MKNVRGTMLLAAVLLAVMADRAAEAQAGATAVKQLEVSSFGALSLNYTGLRGGRNLDLTAGLDLTFKPLLLFYPSLELRGSYPVDGGTIDRQKNVLGGLRLARYVGGVRPYGDFLLGRGAIDYEQVFATPDGLAHYVRSTSNVYSVGGGVDVPLSRNSMLKADAQLERYSTPVTASGHLDSKVVTVGVVYRFALGGRSR